MKKGIVVMVAAAGASAFGITFAPSSTEVVVPADAPKVVRYAAAELTNYLSRAFGSLVPVVAAPHSGTSRIYLGDCAASRSAGIDPARRGAGNALFFREPVNSFKIAGQAQSDQKIGI